MNEKEIGEPTHLEGKYRDQVNELMEENLDTDSKAKTELSNMFYQYGLNGEKTLKAIIESNQEVWDKGLCECVSINIKRNLETIESLEEARPGAARALFDKFGICAFGRYPVELLVDQYDHINDKEMQYGIAIYPRTDCNGAFYQDKEVLKRLQTQLQESGLLLRVYEVGSKEWLYKFLSQADRRYNPNGDNAIKFVVISGHGEFDAIKLTEGEKEETRKAITTNDLNSDFLSQKGRDYLKKIRNFLADQAHIVVQACTSGQKGGVVNEMAKRMKVTTHGSRIPTALIDIQIEFDADGNVAMIPEYNGGTEMCFGPDGEIIYSAEEEDWEIWHNSPIAPL